MMDANCWLGSNIIPNDPHDQNRNGKLFQNFLEHNQHLFLLNIHDLCEGIITRRRQTVKRLEESILDFYIVCEKILPFIKRMVIDEDQFYVLSNYLKVKGKQITKISDHNPIFLRVHCEDRNFQF